MSRGRWRSVVGVLLALGGARLAEAKPKMVAPADGSPPTITHVRVTRAPVGRPIVVRARLDDEHEVFMPAVYVRVQGAADYESLPMTRGEDGWAATIPARSTPAVLEYFLEAFDDQGNGPSREGSPEAPLRLVVGEPSPGAGGGGAASVRAVEDRELPRAAPKDEPVAPASGQALLAAPPEDEGDGLGSQWWFWTIISVGLTGAVVAGVLALQGQGGRVDAVDVTVLGPDPTRGSL